MTNHANGTFEVTMVPQTGEEPAAYYTPGRMMIDKQFYGDLEGTSKGAMLTAMTTVDNSAGYVAIEQVSGKLHGREGTFILQHSGIMNRGSGQLTITVVPDSGTGALTGLAGTMNIIIEDGQHRYEFDYSLS